MKKLFLAVIASLMMCSFSNAQEIGIRLGNVTGGDAAIDAVFSLSKFSRLHADVSFGHGVGIDLLWDFLYRPLGNEPLNWYVGVGPYMLIEDPFYLGVAGEVGLEYRFTDVPIALGFDWRPAFNIIENTDMYWGGFGFNARYVFGKK